MQTVRVDRDELLAKIKGNRDRHRSEFEQAFEGFRRKMRERLEEHLDMLAKGETPPITLNLVIPKDHTDDYDQVIEMLIMSVEESVELQHHEFAQYVRDDWGWKNEHITTSAFYRA